MLGISIPVFLTGIFLITIFSVWLGWLPAFGRGATSRIGFWETGLLTLDGLKHLILPALTLSSIMLPLFIRLVRGAMLDELGHDYVRTARAKGASPPRVWLSHALRNALIPLVAVGGLQVGTLVAYTLLTETVFQWPGMGFLFLEAVTRSDIPLITTYLVAVGFLFVIVNTSGRSSRASCSIPASASRARDEGEPAPKRPARGVLGFATRESRRDASPRSCSRRSLLPPLLAPSSRHTIRSICRASTCSMPSFRRGGAKEAIRASCSAPTRKGAIS